jgi:hypothetical protein
MCCLCFSEKLVNVVDGGDGGIDSSSEDESSESCQSSGGCAERDGVRAREREA